MRFLAGHDGVCLTVIRPSSAEYILGFITKCTGTSHIKLNRLACICLHYSGCEIVAGGAGVATACDQRLNLFYDL